MERWLNRLGFAVQWVGDTARSAREAAADLDLELDADGLVDAADGPDTDAEMDAALSGGATAAAGTAAAWLASRALRPAEIRWSRAVLAGMVGTLLYDAAMLIDQRVSGRKFDTITPLGEALTDDPEMQRWAGWAAHYAAGIVLAVVYARYAHHRLPGPAPLRGAAYGALDAVALQWGGLLPALQMVAPDAALPSGFSALAADPEITAQSLLRHVAYGVGVAAVYDA